jgi:hypothetical protein
MQPVTTAYAESLRLWIDRAAVVCVVRMCAVVCYARSCMCLLSSALAFCAKAEDSLSGCCLCCLLVQTLLTRLLRPRSTVQGRCVTFCSMCCVLSLSTDQVARATSAACVLWTHHLLAAAAVHTQLDSTFDPCSYRSSM